MEQELKALILQKDALEKELEELTKKIQLLDETKDFNKSLVDSAGFPRPDIDFGELANYRNLKRRKAELNNDHYALMKDIEKKLFALHATYPKIQEAHISQTHESKNTQLSFKKKEKKEEEKEEKKVSKIDYLTPFAKVSLVSQGSPASKAKLEVGDLMSQFAEINIYSLDWLKQIPGAVKEGNPIRIVVLRLTQAPPNYEDQVFVLKDGKHYKKIEMELIPAKWQGRGLLGCKLDPLASKTQSA